MQGALGGAGGNHHSGPGSGGGGGAQQHFSIKSDSNPIVDPQAGFGSVLIHSGAVIFTPMFFFSLFPDSTEGPLLFGLDNRDVTAILLLVGLGLGGSAFLYSMARGVSVASSHAALYGVTFSILMRVFIGKTSFLRKEEKKPPVPPGDVPKQAVNDMIDRLRRQKQEATAAAKESGSGLDAATESDEGAKTSAKKQRKEDAAEGDLRAWLERHKLTPIDGYLDVLIDLGAGSVSDVMEYVTEEDLNKLPLVKKRKLWSAISAGPQAKKDD